MKRRRRDDPRVVVSLEPVVNSQLAADLFEVMLRSVEMARQRVEANADDGAATEKPKRL